MPETSLKELVFEALNNAVANGYGAFAYKTSATEVAADMARYDANVEGVPEVQLVPYVLAWRRQQGVANQ